MVIREHPIMIVGRVFKYMVISAVPIIGLSPSARMFFLWEIFVLMLGYFFNRAVLLKEENGKLTFKKGVIFKKQISLKTNMITSVSIKVLRFLGWARIRIYFGATEKISFIILPKSAERIEEYIFGKREKSEAFSFFDTVSTSFFLANSFAGAVTSATFLISIFRVLSGELRRSFIDTLNSIGAKALIYKTPISLMLVGVVFFSWFFSFLSGIATNANFSREENGEFIRLKHGVILKRTNIIKKKNVAYTAKVSTLPSSLFGFRGEFTIADGFSKKAGFYPLTRPRIKTSFSSGRFQRGRIFSFLYKPLLLLLGLPFLYVALTAHITLFSASIKTVFLFAALLIIWRIVFSTSAAFFCGARIEKGIKLRTTRGFLFYDCDIDASKISATRFLYNAFNLSQRGTLTFYTEEGASGRLYLRYIKKKKAQEILEKIKLDCCKNKDNIV